jgi:hypothetical protein
MLRWAKALKNIAENITVYIDDHQLLVGRSGQGRTESLSGIGRRLPDLAIEQLSSGSIPLTSPRRPGGDQRDRAYWKGKTYHEALANALPKTSPVTPSTPAPARGSSSTRRLPSVPASSGSMTMRRSKKGVKRMKKGKRRA